MVEHRCLRWAAAGQTIEHAYIHVIPRRVGNSPDPKSHERCPSTLMTKVAPSCTSIDSKGDRVSGISHRVAPRGHQIRHQTDTKTDTRYYIRRTRHQTRKRPREEHPQGRGHLRITLASSSPMLIPCPARMTTDTASACRSCSATAL